MGCGFNRSYSAPANEKKPPEGGFSHLLRTKVLNNFLTFRDIGQCRRIQKVRKGALLGKDLRGVRTHKARKRNP
ncbi:hypothetical protein LMG26411_08187 [Cupriavidus numazuensis]|uniref:Uncharacterized protein n=1 Tax=Cupriavidus numazuensis TaxID=221992 RepID=A0ABN7QCL2_9BURK|nr:hypothetical protein LMG26411_08187 [Cupriavidus numazuensis]